jgi:tetraacyldisaccharide 4'-kinase
LLDDAFQHRKVKAGFYILLTSFGDLYADDCMLPTGNLRENTKGAQRANVVIVTKCPPALSLDEQNKIARKLKLSADQELFFSSIEYDDCIYSEDKKTKVSDIITVDKLLLAGIAKPEPFFAYLQSTNEECLTFEDHHHFTEKDILDIKKKSINKIVITTEKDYVRLRESLSSENLFYLPIQSQFLSGRDNFDKKIINYVGESAGNR